MDNGGFNSDNKWDKLFTDSEDELKDLGKEALDDYDKGKTKTLDVSKL